MYPPRDMKNPKNVMREASWWLEVYSRSTSAWVDGGPEGSYSLVC